MKTTKIALALALLLACVLAGLQVARNRSPAKQSFVLGVIGNFKGKNAQVGVESFNAIMLAYDEYNKSHPNGFNLSILPVDDSWDATKSLPAYLSCADKADLLIILTSSSNIMLIFDEIHKRPGTVHAILGPTTTLLSGIQDNIVRNVPDLEKEQKMIAEFAAARNIDKLLIVMETDFNGKYTEPAGTFFQQYAHIPHVDVVRFSGHLMNTDAAMDLLRTNRYDAMYALVGGMPREAAILIQQARAIQKDIPVVVTPWVRGLVFEQALGPENNGIFMPCHLKLADNPSYDHFADAYRQMFGAESKEYFVPLMYDLANSLFAALDEAGSPDADTLLPALLAKSYAGTMGPARYDSFGDADSQMHFYEMKNGAWQYASPDSTFDR